MITTTLNRIRYARPCKSGWEKLLTHLGKTKPDDEPLPYATILTSNGLLDTIWCMRCEPDHASTWRLFAVACAREVQHLVKDPRSVAALDVAERFAMGQVTKEELATAKKAADAAAAAYAAAYADADAAADAAYAYAYADADAADAAYAAAAYAAAAYAAAAYAYADADADAAAEAAAYADAAAAAAEAAAYADAAADAAAYAAARAKQATILRELVQ